MDGVGDSTSVPLQREEGAGTQLMIVSLNSAGLTFDWNLLRRALASVIADRKSIRCLAVALQENVASNLSSWEMAARDCGFGHAVAIVEDPKQVVLALYAREADEFSVADTFATRSMNHETQEKNSKGGSVTVISTGKLRLCLGSFHLDGKLPPYRIAQLPAALLRASARTGHVDVALFVGDMNCTVDPEQDNDNDDASTAALLRADFEHFRMAGTRDALQDLSAAALNALQQDLACSAGRSALYRALDGCPATIAVKQEALQYDAEFESCKSSSPECSESMAACGITELALQDMLPGSLPTYRLTQGDASGFEALGCKHDDGIWQFPLGEDVPVEGIAASYFADQKAGTLKKRCGLVRLNLGWIDRLYCGTTKAASTGVNVSQAPPMALRGENGECADHVLVPWIVTIQHN
eukprot:TRINITY_DN76146_c0_g1_i1.p1 TRINITY_DN76146_c0_g1~~TRINITY_DN76146_c0_g1_i1.p1  ORF type:complete len:412 (+),score=64.28 TRINITY_DN76146_c0_g1_i1:126-1361(+)